MKAFRADLSVEEWESLNRLMFSLNEDDDSDDLLMQYHCNSTQMPSDFMVNDHENCLTLLAPNFSEISQETSSNIISTETPFPILDQFSHNHHIEDIKLEMIMHSYGNYKLEIQTGNSYNKSHLKRKFAESSSDQDINGASRMSSEDKSESNASENTQKKARVSRNQKNEKATRSRKNKKVEQNNEEVIINNGSDSQSLYSRRRRERINERLKILRSLVPNGNKVDISTMLEEAVHYVKLLQLQIKLLSSDDLWMHAPISF